MKDKKETTTFGSNLGEGIGCFLILLGIALIIVAFASIPVIQSYRFN